jgi:predicted component of type VI protein secretion system
VTPNGNASVERATNRLNVEANKHAKLPDKGLPQDTFIYSESDGHGGTATATLTVSVIPCPHFQLEAMDIGLSLVSRLPAPAA